MEIAQQRALTERIVAKAQALGFVDHSDWMFEKDGREFEVHLDDRGYNDWGYWVEFSGPETYRYAYDSKAMVVKMTSGQVKNQPFYYVNPAIFENALLNTLDLWAAPIKPGQAGNVMGLNI